MRPKNPEKFERDHRHFLYKEYLRILATHRPTAFVMENVKGLLSSRVGGELIVHRILGDLSALDYRLFSLEDGLEWDGDIKSAKSFLVHAERHGVPQARHRVIIVGIDKNSFHRSPGTLARRPGATVREAIGDLPRKPSTL